jgi:hypothetical protein
VADFNQINQFGSAKPSRSGEGMNCAECEAMLTDWTDGTLTPKDRTAFDLHVANCTECSQMLADAQRGAALLEILKSPRPEPPASLIDRIIAQTSNRTAPVTEIPDAHMIATDRTATGLGIDTAPVAGVATLPGTTSGNLLPFRPRPSKFNLQAITRTMMQPRLAMTAAMAFFSIALTMNLTGVHLNEFKASDLKPSSIRHTFYQADASLVRYYDNLRVVYELESRVNDLKQSSDSDGSQTTGNPQSNGGAGKDKSGSSKDQKRTPKPGSGTSQRRNPLLEEFKLADDQFDQRSERGTDLAVLNHVVLSSKTNKYEETLREGDLV